LQSLQVMLSVPKVDVNIVSVAGWAPLHTAAYEGWDQGVQLLLKAGATIDIRVPATSTQTGHEGKTFINSKGPNLTIYFSLGATPLYFAAIMGRLDVVKTLLENNCEVNLSKLNGGTSPYKTPPPPPN